MVLCCRWPKGFGIPCFSIHKVIYNRRSRWIVGIGSRMGVTTELRLQNSDLTLYTLYTGEICILVSSFWNQHRTLSLKYRNPFLLRICPYMILIFSITILLIIWYIWWSMSGFDGRKQIKHDNIHYNQYDQNGRYQ